MGVDIILLSLTQRFTGIINLKASSFRDIMRINIFQFMLADIKLIKEKFLKFPFKLLI